MGRLQSAPSIPKITGERGEKALAAHQTHTGKLEKVCWEQSPDFAARTRKVLALFFS